MSRYPRLDGIAMEDLESALGADAALALCRQFGGIDIEVPKTIGDRHFLRVALGNVADALAQYYGGSRLRVPKREERQMRVRQLHRTGALTIRGIALETGYSERSVYRLLAERDDRQTNQLPSERDDRQADLFDE